MDAIIIKYLTDTISEKDRILLEKWLEKEENKEAFYSFVQLNFELDQVNIAKIEKELFTPHLARPSQKEPPKKNFQKTLLKYAALITLILGGALLGYYHILHLSNPVENKDGITLELEDGSTMFLEESLKDTLLRNSKGSSIRIVNNLAQYQTNDSTTEEELVFNTLRVPYGYRYQLLLSDSTLIHLNAGSSIRFPKKFLPQHHREVYLEGEAYFEVSEDAEHPFIVHIENLNIEVLGTAFNVSAYAEDEDIKTVLVEGSVQLNYKEEAQETPLVPGQKGTWNRFSEGLSKQMVETDLYTSWIHGELIFRESAFSHMRKVLERSYDVHIVNNNPLLDQTRFNASFHVNIENIDHVFQSMAVIYGFDYTIEANKVIINPPKNDLPMIK